MCAKFKSWGMFNCQRLEWINAECRQYKHVTVLFTTEMLACKDAVLLACSKGWSQVVIKTDCPNIILAWSGEKEQRSSCSQLVKEMKVLVSNFQGFSICFVKEKLTEWHTYVFELRYLLIVW
jgi:hypothetical protein